MAKEAKAKADELVAWVFAKPALECSVSARYRKSVRSGSSMDDSALAADDRSRQARARPTSLPGMSRLSARMIDLRIGSIMDASKRPITSKGNRNLQPTDGFGEGFAFFCFAAGAGRGGVPPITVG